jgi:hypothetical protein
MLVCFGFFQIYYAVRLLAKELYLTFVDLIEAKKRIVRRTTSQLHLLSASRTQQVEPLSIGI